MTGTAAVPCVESWAAWESRVEMLKADGPAVRSLWSIDCKEACVTAAVRTWRKTKTEKDTHTVKAVLHTERNLKKALLVNIKPCRLAVFLPCGEKMPHFAKSSCQSGKTVRAHFSYLDGGLIVFVSTGRCICIDFILFDFKQHKNSCHRLMSFWNAF